MQDAIGQHGHENLEVDHEETDPQHQADQEKDDRGAIGVLEGLSSLGESSGVRFPSVFRVSILRTDRSAPTAIASNPLESRESRDRRAVRLPIRLPSETMRAERVQRAPLPLDVRTQASRLCTAVGGNGG